MGNAILLVETLSDSVAPRCLSRRREYTTRSGIMRAGWEAGSHGRMGKSRREGEFKKGKGIRRVKYGQAVLYDVRVNVNF